MSQYDDFPGIYYDARSWIERIAVRIRKTRYVHNDSYSRVKEGLERMLKMSGRTIPLIDEGYSSSIEKLKETSLL